jgi:hypothetical protein
VDRAAALACLFVLGAASPVVAARATTGVLEGRVLEDRNRKGDRPAAFASVSIPELRRGAQADETGAFRIADLPPGRYVVRIALPGTAAQTRTVDIRRGKTTRLELRLPSLFGPDVGDIGPAFPDPATRRRLAKAKQVGVFRIANSTGHRGDSLFHAHPPWSATHVLLAREDHPSRDWLERLRRLLASPESHRAYPAGVVKPCGGFDPGVVVRFTDGSGVSDVLLCFKCEELKVITDGRSGPIVDFAPLAREYAELALEVFPGDTGLATRSRRKGMEPPRGQAPGD